VHSDGREHGFPTHLFSWCRVQRTRSVGTRCLVTANDSRDNSISYNSFTWSPSGRGAKRCWQQDRPGFLPSTLRREVEVEVPCAHGLNWGKLWRSQACFLSVADLSVCDYHYYYSEHKPMFGSYYVLCHVFRIFVLSFLCFVKRASLYNLVNRTNLVHNFS